MDEAGQDLRKLQQAQNLFKNGKLEESESLFNSLVKSPHVGPRAQCSLGLTYLSKGQIAEARDLFNSVIGAGHHIAEAHYGLGRIFEDTEPGYARAQYEFALRINPKHRGSLARLERFKSPLVPSTEEAKTAPHDSRASSPVTEGVVEPVPADSFWRRILRPAPVKRANPQIQGIARNLRHRTEQHGRPLRQVQIIEFSLQRAGGLAPVPVYMKGISVKGLIKEGDEIVLQGKLPKVNSIYETTRVHNRSTGGPVETAGPAIRETYWWNQIGEPLGVILFVALAIIIAVIASR